MNCDQLKIFIYQYFDKTLYLTLNFTFQKVISFTKTLPNFITLGRNANFKYLHTHELFNQAEECIRQYNS